MTSEPKSVALMNMVWSKHGPVPGCPNTPPCSHARMSHDVEDYDDPLPMCCAEGCLCGHDRSALPPAVD